MSPSVASVTVLRWIVFAGSLAYILLFAVLACLRARYPFELEWLEGTSVDHVSTILSGRPLYAAPSLAFVPLTYTPGYFYAGAGLMKIMGVGILPLRLISIGSAVALLVLLAKLAIYETRDIHAGVLAAGLFTAMYGWTDGWLDIARTDSLFLALALAAVYVLRRSSSTMAVVSAGVLISLAFLVKQTALLIAIALGVWCVLRGWRSFAAFAGVVLAIVGGSTLILNHVFDGWYVYYVFAVPSQHKLSRELLLGFWRYDFLRPMPIAVASAGAYLIWQIAAHRSQRALFYLLVAAGFVGSAYVLRLHSLSYINVVLPAYLAASLIFAIAVYDERVSGARGWVLGARGWVLGTRVSAPAASPGGARLRGPRLRTALYLLCALQLARVAYRPSALVPTSDDERTGCALVERIAAMPGDVFVVDHGYLPSLAGKPMHAHGAMIADVIRGGQTSTEQELAYDLRHALKQRQFDSIVIRDEPSAIRAWLPLEKYYRPAEPVVTVRSRFWHPETRYVPR